MGIQINGNTNNINAGIGSLSIEDLNELDIVGVATASNFKTGVSNLHNVGLTLSGGQIDVGSNIKLGNAGVITATSFVGSGANLTGISGVSVANQGDNRLITATGTTDALNGEANLNFDGTGLGLVGHIDIRTGSSINTNVTGGSASGTLHKNTTSGQFAIVSGGTGGNNYLSFFTSASAAPTEKLRIHADGEVEIKEAAAGIAKLVQQVLQMI